MTAERQRNLGDHGAGELAGWRLARGHAADFAVPGKPFAPAPALLDAFLHFRVVAEPCPAIGLSARQFVNWVFVRNLLAGRADIEPRAALVLNGLIPGEPRKILTAFGLVAPIHAGSLNASLGNARRLKGLAASVK